jgi:eukaryotic-like serine/threonine-protein kinase
MQRIDKYEVLEVIGRGAMGAVYKALHPQFKKYVAIKEILADLAQHPEIQQRFEREAELLAHLPAHPNIVTVRDALVWQGKLYLVMDYIEGGTLAELVKQGGVKPERAITILEQVLSGLEAIHARGIIHRDLKASNILLGSDGTAYLSDFGIAESTKHSQAGDAMATAKCVAPEMIDPALGRNAEPQQADIYAAGILAYEMLLGETKFRHALPEIYSIGEANKIARNWLAWHTDLTRPAPNLQRIEASIPSALATIVERMMAKDVNTRYRNARDVRRDLAAITNRNVAMNEQQRPAADDATVPLSQIRNQQVSHSSAPPPVRPLQSAPVTRANLIPGWLLPVAGAAVFLLLAVGLWAMNRNPGFTVIVKGIAPSSDLYVNDIRRGIPTIGTTQTGQAEGELQVTGLKAGELYTLRLGCGELLRDKLGVNKLTGENGDEIVLQAKCGTVAATPDLPEEINLKGPMRLVKAGPFLMGDDNGRPNEAPVHKVDLNYDYYIDKFEVTNQQFDEFCKANPGRKMPENPWWDPNYVQNNPNQPVVGITYDDAVAYAKWAGKELPTEAEWEKAASWDPNATDAEPKWKRRWPWGNTAAVNANIGSKHPINVGQKAAGASAYGVVDMVGNAAEWVASHYQPYPGNQVADPDYGNTKRVVRGNSFLATPDLARTTVRDKADPVYSAQALVDRSWLIGFRCAARADSPKIKEMLQKK